jgi:hypothetical protein
MKFLKQLDLKTLTILGLIVVLLLMRMCSYNGNPQKGDTIKIKVLSYSTIMNIASNNTELKSITITKQYEKKIK